MRTIREATKENIVIVDAGSGVIDPLQKELLLRADIILVVVTPYLMTYHHLWRMWQNAFFIPYEQINKSGLIVNQFHGSVTSQDIATLMDLWLAGELPVVKRMTSALNHGNLEEAFSKNFIKRLKDIIERSTERMEKTNTMVKQKFMNPPVNFNYEQEKATEWVVPETWEMENVEQNEPNIIYPTPEDKEEWHFES